MEQTNILPPSVAREALAAALAHKSGAEAELAGAERAVFSARQLVDGVKAEVEQFIAADRQIANARAASIKAAMKGVDGPDFVATPSDLPRIVVARAEAENRFAAARQAEAELAEEATAARQIADQAAGAVIAAANAVAAAEAEEIAVEIERLEAAALGLRLQLGGGITTSPLIVLTGLGQGTRRALVANDTTDIGVLNSAEWRTARIFADRLRAYMKRLAVDASATLSEGSK